MNRTTLGRTGIEVSEYCLGTMTFGTQTSENDSHTQIEMALEAGIDFLDTAEMYPVNPVLKETVGRTEEIIGNWNAKSGRRSEVVIATKHSGQGGFVRPGRPITKDTIEGTLNGSLKRLQTDYVDLYQLHWPNRGSYHFRQNWGYDPSKQPSQDAVFDEMCGILEKLKEMEAAGKIRSFGLSNESAWGTLQFLRLAENLGLPRVATIQNEYSLMCRYYDMDMAELSHHEDVGLLAFSPLATGLLTGKYKDGAFPDGSRGAINASLGGRNVPWAHDAVAGYQAVADKHGLALNEMAIAFCLTRPFMLAPIIGATTMEQLKSNIDAADLTLSEDVMNDISEARRNSPMPI